MESGDVTWGKKKSTQFSPGQFSSPGQLSSPVHRTHLSRGASCGENPSDNDPSDPEGGNTRPLSSLLRPSLAPAEPLRFWCRDVDESSNPPPRAAALGAAVAADSFFPSPATPAALAAMAPGSEDSSRCDAKRPASCRSGSRGDRISLSRSLERRVGGLGGVWVTASVVGAVARGCGGDDDDVVTPACCFRRENNDDRDDSGAGSGLAAPDDDVETPTDAPASPSGG